MTNFIDKINKKVGPIEKSIKHDTKETGKAIGHTTKSIGKGIEKGANEVGKGIKTVYNDDNVNNNCYCYYDIVL